MLVSVQMVGLFNGRANKIKKIMLKKTDKTESPQEA